MKIIISPAKKMNQNTDGIAWDGTPEFMERTRELGEWIRSMTIGEAKMLWKCSQKLTEFHYERFKGLALDRNLTPALLSYEGIQYQYMAPHVFEDRQWEYVQEHLRILSGFYGMLRPLDGVVPYRLEMQAKGSPDGDPNLYTYWGNLIYEKLAAGTDCILNLASKEYSRCIEKYLTPDVRYITCTFGEKKGGKVIQKGTEAKIARGEMVKFLAENNITEPEGAKEFGRLSYCFRPELSGPDQYVFLKDQSNY